VFQYTRKSIGHRFDSGRSDTLLSLLFLASCLLPVACCLLPVARCLLPVARCLLPFAVCCSLPLLVGLLHATRYTPQTTRHKPHDTPISHPPGRHVASFVCLTAVSSRRSPVAGRRPALVISPCGFLPRSTHRLSAKVAQQKQFDRPKHPSTPVTDRPTAAQLDSPRPRTGTGTRTGTREDIILARVCPCCARYRVRMLTMWQACLQRRQFVSESESGMKRG
jgi:hypothetical protein